MRCSRGGEGVRGEEGRGEEEEGEAHSEGKSLLIWGRKTLRKKGQPHLPSGKGKGGLQKSCTFL